MSISRIQREKAIAEIAKKLYSDGVEPLVGQIQSKLSQHLAKNPAGNILPLPSASDFRGVAEDTVYNQLLKNSSTNLDILYEASLDQIDSIIDLTSSLVNNLDRMNDIRDRLSNKIDDYLMSLYNTDGYFYALSDNFSDLSMVDLSMTSAYVDIDSRSVVLPPIATGSKKLETNLYHNPSVRVFERSNRVSHRELADFGGAIEDSLQNTLWAIEAKREKPTELIAVLQFKIGESGIPVEMNELIFKPYGSSAVQVFVETAEETGGTFTQFGNRILRSTNKMLFEDAVRSVREVRITLRKTDPDFTDYSTGKLYYHYLFGAKTLSIIRQTYERNASLITAPLRFDEDLVDETAIDRVTLTVDGETPNQTSIDYYVAISNGNEETINDLNWRPIFPLNSDSPGDKVINFAGSDPLMRRITSTPEDDDLKLIDLQFQGPTEILNPNPSIIRGIDIYRLAEWDEEDIPLSKSMHMIEGRNATKIYSRSQHPDAMSLSFWGEEIKKRSSDLDMDFGRIDSGNEFFYGGDLDGPGKSVYVETYLNAHQSWELFLSEFQKADRKALDWDVKVFLNNTELGYLPQGTRSSMLPWRFREGLNHIMLLINIPEEGTVPDVYTGVLKLFSNNNLFDFGDVYLAKWNYVDFFTMKYNELGTPKTFTFYNNEIISRRRPSNDLVLYYANKNATAPEALRLRADLQRGTRSPYLTPQLNKYSLKFSYR